MKPIPVPEAYRAPFFILGNPRSGTSMFRLMLNRHPMIVVPPECGYILWFYESYKNHDFADAKVRKRFTVALASARKFETWGVSSESLFRFLKGYEVRSYADVCSLIHSFYAVNHDKIPERWGDKNNYYIGETGKLRALFPESRFLFLVRDPRDVYVSYLEMKALRTDSAYAPNLTVALQEFCDEWNRNWKTAHQFSENEASKVMLLKYEDIVLQTERSLRSVLAFLGVGFHRSVLSPVASPRFIEREPYKTRDWKLLTDLAPDGRRIGRFREALTRDQADFVEVNCRVGMTRMGYL